MASDRELINRALRDAADWQMSLAAAYAHIKGSPECLQAVALAERYRALLKRRGRPRIETASLGDKDQEEPL
jgi:hypothetical protein